MFEGITNWVEDKVAGYAKTGIQAGGSLAGNAVGGIGSLVESAGRSAGDSKPTPWRTITCNLANGEQ